MKMIALLFIILLFFAMPALAEQPPAGSDKGDAVPTLAQYRYIFEHRMLPIAFYEQPEAMLNAIERVGIYGLWTSFCTKNGLPSVYSPEDFSVHRYCCDDGTVIVQLEMPDPFGSTLCERIYFVHNAGSGNTAYFTVEYNEMLGGENFLCGWTKARRHINYDSLTPLDSSSADYEDALRAEAEHVAEMAGASPTLIQWTARSPRRSPRRAPRDGKQTIF